jgi:hypothetical protein
VREDEPRLRPVLLHVRRQVQRDYVGLVGERLGQVQKVGGEEADGAVPNDGLGDGLRNAEALDGRRSPAEFVDEEEGALEGLDGLTPADEEVRTGISTAHLQDVGHGAHLASKVTETLVQQVIIRKSAHESVVDGH